MALSGSVTTDYWYSSGGQTRGYRLDWTAVQSIANNTSTISWSLSTDGTYSSRVAERTLYVVIAGNVVVNKVDRVMRGPGVVASGSFTAYHASDGTFGFTASIEAAVYESTVNCTGSASFTLNQIPRQATIISANDITDEQNPSFTFSNPGGFDLIAELEINPTNTHLFSRTIGNTGSHTFELTEIERNTLRSYLKNANSGTLRYLLYSNSSQFVSYADRTISIVNGQPTLTASVEDINPDTVALTGDSSVMVRYASNAAVSMTATAKKGASITSRRIICGGKYLTTDSGTLEAVDSGKFTFSATDSRGNTATQTLDKTLIEYVKPTCLLHANAPNADGEMSFSISGNCYAGSFGVSDNAIHAFYRYKEEDGEYAEWVEAEVTTSGGTYQADVSITGMDYTKQYTFQAKATDELMTSESKERAVKTVPVFDWSGKDFNFNVPVTMNNGLAYLMLAEGADLDVILTPNTYTGLDASTAGYLHCPVSEGRFTLEVFGTADALTQRLTLCEKGKAYVYERHYYGEAWGAWVMATLGYTPVQQGTGVGQLGNSVKIGWTGARLKATVDVTDLGNFVFDDNVCAKSDDGNGNKYYKFPDGTLICTKAVAVAVECASAWGSGLYDSPAIDLGNWPHAFASTPATTITFCADASSGFGMVEGLNGTSATTVGATYLCRGSSGGCYGNIHVIGIGRWK